MKVCACVLLFTIFANFVRSAAGFHPQQDEKSVHLALETVLEFNNKDKESDIKFLDKVQNFVNKVRTVIDKTANYRRDFNDGDVESLTDFIQQTVKVLNSYDDKTFNEFFSILDDEIRKYHYRGCKFYELLENFEIRSLFGYTLDQIKGKPVLVIKAYINVLADVLKEENYDKNVKEIIDSINSLYREDSKAKLNKVLLEIQTYGKVKSRRNHNTLVKIIREGIRSILFDHYTELNANARRELKTKIEMYLKKNKDTTVLPYTVTVRNIARPEKQPKKSPLHGVYKKGTVQNEHKLDRIDIRNTDFKKDHQERDARYEKDVRHVRKEKNKLSKFSEIPLPTVNVKEELRARSEEESYDSLSSEDNSVTSETIERNSIAMSQEKHKEYNHMRYVTLYPEEFTPLYKEDKIVHRAAKASTPAQQRILTMWVEETTGGIPKYILNKYTSTTKKPRQPKHKKTQKKKNKTHKKSKRNKHDKYKTTEGTLMKHGHKSKKHDTTKHTKRNVAKHTVTHKAKQEYLSSKHKKKQKYVKDNKVHKLREKNETRSTKKHKNAKNLFGPVRLDVNHNLLLKNITVRQTKPTSPSLILRQRENIEQLKKSLKPDASTARPKIGLLLPASLAAISKRYQMLSGPGRWNLRKDAKNQADEGVSDEKTDKNIAKANRRQGSSSMENPFVIKRMKELENELKEVKNKINTVMKKKETKFRPKKQGTERDKSNENGKDNIEVKEKYPTNEDEDNENNIKASSYEMASEDVSNDNNNEKTTKIITTVTEEQKVTTTKKPEYQVEYKIVKEKGSEFKEIIPDHGTEENKPVKLENKDKNADIDTESASGKIPLDNNAIRHSNDKRHKNFNNKTDLIDSATRISQKTLTTEYTTTETITEKVSGDVTNTKRHHAKPTTVASTSVAIENSEKPTKNENMEDATVSDNPPVTIDVIDTSNADRKLNNKQHETADPNNNAKGLIGNSDKNVVENSLVNEV